MVIQAACPDPDVIRDLLNGSLPEAEQAELSSHFDLCPSCQQQFDAEASGPQFLGDVARLCRDTDWPHNTPTLDRLIRDMPQQLSDAADEASVATWSTEAVSDFLDTSENTEHLGRLGSYEIVEVIGRGGMGIVLRGIDSRLNRVVAIKVLAPELASNPNARRRFYREGQAAAAVSHDNVVTIHAVDDHERLPYLVMEFVAGESLEECIRRAGPLPVESILRMGRQAALGLAAAHEVGLVHRDMKPANILLENGIQRVRITDFGLARATDDVSMTQTGTVTGTPLYMSPEQAGGEKIDHRSDLFSLGSVLYTMCTGRPAFRAQTTLGVIKRVCEDTPRPIRDVNPDIPQWLADIIDRLMAKQPDDRIQDAAELAELLGNHLAHLQDPENVPAPAGTKPAPKQRTLKSLILAVLLIGGVGLGITEAAGVTEVGKFLGIVLRLKTPEGTLVIEIEDPDVEVSVDGSEVVLSGITKKELRLKPGKYQYRATRKGEPAESDWVTIERDGKTVVRILQLPTEVPGAVTESPKTAARSAWAVDPETWTRNPEDLKSHRSDGRPLAAPPEDFPVGESTDRNSTNGISLLSPARIRRFVPDEIVPVWFGKWYFKNIPEQLYGQNFAFTSLDGGLLEFDVSKVSGRNLNQRIWLLIPHQDWDGSRTTSIPEDHDPSLKFATRESMIAFGWSAWNDITSEHVAAHPNQPTTEMKWSVFYRDAKPGEKYRVRTHWKHTPMLVWGSTKLDNVTVEPSWDQRIAVFGRGASVPLGNGSSIFHEVPDHLIGRLYTKRNSYSGAARFVVQRDQKVTIAMYEWGHENDGNPSGNWRHELTSREQMVQSGWREAGELNARHTNRELPDATWFLYTKDCEAGERFLLRNHKYQAPIVFSEKTYFENGPIDLSELPLDRHARIQAEERLAKLVEEFNTLFKQKRYAESATVARQAMREFPKNPAVELMTDRAQFGLKTGITPTDIPADGPLKPQEADAISPKNKAKAASILLDSSKVKTQLADRIGKPGVYGTRGSVGQNAEQAIQFFRHKSDELKDGYRKSVRLDGYSMLVGQIPVTTQPDDRFELEHFDRTGNQLRIAFRQNTKNTEFSAVTNQGDVFRDASAESLLLSTLRMYGASIKKSLTDNERKKLLSDSQSEIAQPSGQFLGTNLLSQVQIGRLLRTLRPEVDLPDDLQFDSLIHIEQARAAMHASLNWRKRRSQLRSTRQDFDKQKESLDLAAHELSIATRLPLCTREEAFMYEIGSHQYTSLMRQAASEFEAVYRNHRSQFAGLHAQLIRARCLADVGDFEMARRICEEFPASPESPLNTPNIEFLHARAIQFLISSLIDGHLEEPSKAIELGGEWLSTADEEMLKSVTASYIMWEQTRAMYVASLPVGSDLPLPTAAPAVVHDALARRLRKMTRVLLRWPVITTGPFAEHATALKAMLNHAFPDEVAVSQNPDRSLYFETPLPTLPPGTYEIAASVRVLPHPASVKLNDLLVPISTAPDPVGSPTTPSLEESAAITGKLTVPGSDADAAELKRLAVLAIVTKPASNDAFELKTSSSTEVDISELISRSGQLEDVAKMDRDAKKSELYLDELRRAGKKWAMCAHLDHENVDVKIHAAKALAKLADPDTVAVLAIAAKRNAYGVMGSENATLHSIYQAELKLALEGATGLKLTPAGLFLTYKHTDEVPPRTVVHHSELNPDMFRSETDFARIDEWLRNVYLADSEIPAVPAPEPEGTIPTAKTIYTGLVGRLSIRTLISNGPGKPSTIKHVDPGYIFQYPQGQFFHRDVLPLEQINDRHFVVNLTGQLDVPRDMVVKIWHAGGGVSHDECGLYVDGTLLGVVGDDRNKHNIYEVPLLKGRHDIRWELSGGTFRTNILLFKDPETERLLPITNAGPESVRKDSEDRVVKIRSTRTDWPVSAKPDWLPKIVVTTETDPAATNAGQ